MPPACHRTHGMFVRPQNETERERDGTERKGFEGKPSIESISLLEREREIERKSPGLFLSTLLCLFVVARASKIIDYIMLIRDGSGEADGYEKFLR